MELTGRLKAALKEISQWKEYPPNWKAKSRERLEELGLVENKFASTPEATPAYQLTQKGWDLLAELN